MRGSLRLAWRYLSWYWGRSVILVLCLTLTLLLPFAVTMLVDVYGARFRARAQDTPFVVGAPGSRYDLVLNTLYFRGHVRRSTSMAEVKHAEKDDLALVVPMHVGTHAEDQPLVGTTYDYATLRHFSPRTGRLVQMPGECVLGSGAAAALGKGTGDSVFTDTGNVYDFGLAYQIKLHVVGVLRETGTADDRAIFTDLQTIWIMLGIEHGHQDAERIDAGSRAGVKNGTIQLNAKTHLYTEITRENVQSFHFHADPEGLPVTSMIIVPHDGPARTFLRGRYTLSKTAEMLQPTVVVDELLEFVFQLKRFFDANVILVSLATALFLTLVVLLSLRVRQREIQTLFKIGCARLTVFRTVAIELGIVILAGTGLAALFAWIATRVLLRDFLP